MVITMTNRLLALVIAVALSGGIAAHAAQSPHQPIGPIALASATTLPNVLQTAAGHLTETATGAIDPSAAIRSAYQRDHVALEHLRQQASALKGSAHPAFNQYISDQEAALTELERTSLATTRPSADAAIASMDALVAAAQAKLGAALAQPTATKSNGSNNANRAQGQANSKQGKHD